MEQTNNIVLKIKREGRMMSIQLVMLDTFYITLCGAAAEGFRAGPEACTGANGEDARLFTQTSGPLIAMLADLIEEANKKPG